LKLCLLDSRNHGVAVVIVIVVVRHHAEKEDDALIKLPCWRRGEIVVPRGVWIYVQLLERAAVAFVVVVAVVPAIEEDEQSIGMGKAF
jgi:hypothetical protein